MIRATLVLCVWSLVLGAQSMNAAPSQPPRGARTLYVAPNGSDRHPGTKDRPLATLAEARATVRQWKEAAPGSIDVVLRGGTYYLDAPLEFTADDSGTPAAPVVYRAAAGETPVISGGFTLALAWQPFENETMQAAVPETVAEIDQLFVNGRRLPMARYPNFDPEAKFFGGTSGQAIAPQRVKTWSNPAGGYMHALHAAMWGSKHYRIVAADPQGNLTLQGGWQENRGGGFDPYFRGGFHKDLLFVENIFEELDAPGEWYFDKQQHILYVRPEPGVDLAKAEILGAGLKELFVVEGTSAAPVRGLRFEGLTFRHTARVFMEPYERLLRGDWSIARLAAIRFEGAEDCHVRACRFEDLGGNAVFLSGYNRRVDVTGCRFTRLGESGVCVVGDYGAVRSGAVEYSRTLPQDEIDLTPGPRTSDYPAHCRIHDNLMHHFGLVGKQVAGVVLSMSEAITVSHNTIYQCPRAAICINDGCWGGHIIEFNDAFNTVRESGDHGPFNSWGRDRWWKTSYNGGRDVEPFAKERSRLDNRQTTHIRNNRFAHPGGHSWGIDLDDGSSNYRVYNNLCLGLGVKLREGFSRQVENNVIINGFGGFHIWLPGGDDIITRNIFVSDKPYQFIRANPAYAKTIDFNLFYWAQGRPTMTGVGDPMSLEQWQAKGFDTHSVFADPQFVDPENGDYRVKPGSPALALGFVNVPMDRFGVLTPALQREAAAERRHFKPAPTRPAATPARSSATVAWRGATVKNLVGEAEKSAAGLGTETGVLLVQVPDNCQAARLGFREGDVLLQMAGRPVETIDDLSAISGASAGQTVTVVVFSATERRFEITLD